MLVYLNRNLFDLVRLIHELNGYDSWANESGYIPTFFIKKKILLTT